MTGVNESILTLETVTEDFARWRRDKKKGERIPEVLWREAVALLERYRISHVVRALRLSGSDLKRRQRLFAQGQPTELATQQPVFVEIDVPPLEQVDERTASTWLEFQRPDGVSLRVHSADEAQVFALVDRFIGGSSC